MFEGKCIYGYSRPIYLFNKPLQAVCEIAKRYVELYFESRKQNLKQRFYICLLTVILILLVMVQIISLFLLLEK